MFNLGSNVKSLKDCILKLLMFSLFIFTLSNYHLTAYAGNNSFEGVLDEVLELVEGAEDEASKTDEFYSAMFIAVAKSEGCTADSEELSECAKESLEKFKGDDDYASMYGDADLTVEYIKNEIKNKEYGLTFTINGMKSISADPLGNIGEDSTDTTQIKNLGGGAISIIRTFAVLGMVISLITGAITLMVNGYRAKNAVASDVSSKLLVIVVIGGLSFFINVVLTIAKAL